MNNAPQDWVLHLILLQVRVVLRAIGFVDLIAFAAPIQTDAEQYVLLVLFQVLMQYFLLSNIFYDCFLISLYGYKHEKENSDLHALIIIHMNAQINCNNVYFEF